MGKDNRQKLRELAEELANVEANIFVLRDFSPGNPRHEQKEAAQIAINTVSTFLKGSQIEKVIFNVFKEDDEMIYQQLLNNKSK